MLLEINSLRWLEYLSPVQYTQSRHKADVNQQISSEDMESKAKQCIKQKRLKIEHSRFKQV